MDNPSSIQQNVEMTPIAKATFALSASLERARSLCRVIKVLIAIGALVYFAVYLLVWILLLIASLQTGFGGEESASLIAFFLIGACEAVGALMAYRFFSELVRDDAVFTSSQIKRLRRIALVFVVLFVLELVSPSSSMVMADGGAGQIGLVGDAASFPSAPRINLSSLLFAAVFYCAAAIFEYASLLQQASDETI